MWVPPCGDNEIPNPYLHPPSIFHGSYSMEEIPEWLMKPMVKTNTSILQDDVTVHNSSLEYDLDFCFPLSSICHDSLYRDMLDQSTPPANFSHSLYFQSIGPNWVQGSHITQVKE